MSTQRSEPHAAPGVGEPAFVAIVDDDEAIRNAWLRLMRSAGYSAATFASAIDFLSSLSLRRPRCVVLDLHLPGMTGIELLQRFAELDDPPPVVMLTASDDRCLRDQCMALGAKRYFRKPVDCLAVLEAISETLRIARLRPSRLR